MYQEAKSKDDSRGKRSPEKSKDKFDCTTDKTKWSKKQTRWCCKKKNICKEEKPGFNCLSKEKWSKKKKKWCCKNKKLGCKKKKSNEPDDTLDAADMFDLSKLLEGPDDKLDATDFSELGKLLEDEEKKWEDDTTEDDELKKLEDEMYAEEKKKLEDKKYKKKTSLQCCECKAERMQKGAKKGDAMCAFQGGENCRLRKEGAECPKAGPACEACIDAEKQSSFEEMLGVVAESALNVDHIKPVEVAIMYGFAAIGLLSIVHGTFSLCRRKKVYEEVKLVEETQEV